ncbi:MAG: hypothetical protein PHU71_00410 [Candidatus Gracilibacteria bacterium]|nr:hypothetical protein [Candidatus Gracilibacteria bacterium]
MIEESKAILTKLLELCLVQFDEIQVQEEGGIVRLNVLSSESPFLIGRHGEHLFALQQVLRLLTRKQLGEEAHVVLDVDNYRKNLERNSELVAKDIAKKVLQTGIAEELAPMPSYRRRAVHTSFVSDPEFKDLKIYSVGEGEERRIRIEKINRELFDDETTTS